MRRSSWKLPRPTVRSGLLLAPALAAAALAPASAGAATQQLLGRTSGGGLPNGVASEPDISRDSRINRYVAYTSTATNIASGVQAGRRNVYLVRRTGTATRQGNPWQVGPTTLVSRGLGGAPANGDSWGARLSGFTGRADAPGGPRLVAFLSDASNLVRGGTSTASAYVRKVSGGRITRISAPGTATGVDVSGDSKVVWVTTTEGLYRWTGKKAKRIKRGSGFGSPSTNAIGNQVVYERKGTVYLATSKGGSKRIGRGTRPDADDGSNAKKIRAVAFTRGGGAYRAILGRRVRTERFGSTSTPAAINAGASAIAFGQGGDVRLQVKVLDSGKAGGYARPQGSCPSGQGAVTGVAVSTRYNYLAFACARGGLYLSYVGGK